MQIIYRSRRYEMALMRVRKNVLHPTFDHRAIMALKRRLPDFRAARSVFGQIGLRHLPKTCD